MRLLRSFSFRLSVIYAALFLGSVTLVLATYQLVSITLPRQAVKEALEVEADAFASAYRGDPRALVAPLERRAGEDSPRAAFHLLVDRNGAVVATNLPSWPRYDGEKWVSIEADIYRDGDEDDHEALALDRQLPDGTRLLVGRDVEELDDLQEAISSAAFHLIAATLALVTLGAWLMNRAIGRRLASISASARQVMGGDLGERVPTSGTGDDFDRLALTLNLMLDRVEAGVEAVRTVSDSVAHELRTPVTRLQASLRALAADGGGGSQALAEAMAEADRLQAIFDAVLRISRIESGRHSANFSRLDLAELIADSVDLYGPAAEERGIRLIRETDGALPAHGDRDLLFQALANLIDNAIKFSPDGANVVVRGWRDEKGARITVVDTGPGIDEDLAARLGERFLRGPAARAKPGFGLGLSLAKAIVKLHGGTIEFHRGDPGLAVEIRLPAAADA
ncbi:MAG: HAMP domain-containing sensor histidine kinase [Allosphingosinicella sp.]